MAEAESRKLRMQYAGGMLKHLGLQMYGGAVPAIAELVANAWDADARHVEITIPLGKSIRRNSMITVLDDGIGMTFEEINDSYLVLGRDRRNAGHGKTPSGRSVMGRKGIGKLAGFGIAQTIRVDTKRNNRLTTFEMNFREMLKESSRNPYEPTIIYDGPDTGSAITGDHGTRISLSDLQIKKAIPTDGFHLSMARRFSILGDIFTVSINGGKLERDQLDLEFRFPDQDTTTEKIPGMGTVRWWVGFTEKPITQEEARGIVVLVRGKLAQSPFFFNLSRGTGGQLGMQYMTGEVHADGLDHVEDLISTDRASVRWDHPLAAPLLDWGEKKVREALQKWAYQRREKNREKVIRHVKRRIPHYDRIQEFPDPQQRELMDAVNKIAEDETILDERLAQIVDFLLRAYKHEYLFNLIEQINAADEDSLKKIQDVIGEWDVLEAIAVAQVARGRLAIIDKFRQLLDDNSREMPDMQEFIEQHPWILRPEWAPLTRNRSIETIVKNQPGFSPKKKEHPNRKQPDFFCLESPGTYVVVELKRPGESVGRDELHQLSGYVDDLKDHLTNDPGQAWSVYGFLVYHEMKAEANNEIARLKKDGMYIERWDMLWVNADRLHRDYYNVMKSRCEDDVRVPPLDQEQA